MQSDGVRRFHPSEVHAAAVGSLSRNNWCKSIVCCALHWAYVLMQGTCKQPEYFCGSYFSNIRLRNHHRFLEVRICHAPSPCLSSVPRSEHWKSVPRPSSRRPTRESPS